MESDVPVRHQGESLEDKWNMDSQSGDRSDLEMETSESHQHYGVGGNWL